MSNGSASPAAPPAPQPDNDAAGVLPAAASTPAPAAAPAPAKHPATTSTPSTVSRTSAEPAAAKPQPRKSTGLQGPYATLNAIKAIAFKKAPPPPPPPAPLPAPSAATGSPIEGSSSGTRVRFANGPGAPAPPRAAAQPQPAHSALRQTAAQPALRAPTPQPAAAPPAAAAEKVTPAALPATAAASPAAASPPDEADAGKSEAEIAEAAAKQAEADRTRRLVEMERRLRATSWCGKDPRFEQEALPVACAKAIPIDAPLVRRLKRCALLPFLPLRSRHADVTSLASSKGVAVLFSNREDTMGGEGLALGYLLMSMGAVTPDKLEGVEAVFIHRNDSFAQLEALYAELVNLPSHAVEFFRFGGGEPVEDIFRAGAYCSAFRLSRLLHTPDCATCRQATSSFQRSRLCGTPLRTSASALPFATYMRARVKCLRTPRPWHTCAACPSASPGPFLPDATPSLIDREHPGSWFTIVARLGTTGVEIIDRDELPLSSAFAGTEKSTLMAPAASWPSSIPQVEASAHGPDLSLNVRVLMCPSLQRPSSARSSVMSPTRASSTPRRGGASSSSSTTSSKGRGTRQGREGCGLTCCGSTRSPVDNTRSRRLSSQHGSRSPTSSRRRLSAEQLHSLSFTLALSLYTLWGYRSRRTHNTSSASAAPARAFPCPFRSVRLPQFQAVAYPRFKPRALSFRAAVATRRAMAVPRSSLPARRA